MTILQPGTFKVSDYRRPIPRWIERWVLIRQAGCADDGQPFDLVDCETMQFDHRPALQDRPYDTRLGDFMPPQHDPAKIFAVRAGQHLERTTGRREGAEQTVTTKGSDSHNRKHARKVRDTEAIHQAAMAAKAGDPARADAERSRVTQESRLAPKRRIPSGPLRSRNDFQQRGRK